jgi:hypothetical protein
MEDPQSENLAVASHAVQTSLVQLTNEELVNTYQEILAKYARLKAKYVLLYESYQEVS